MQTKYWDGWLKDDSKAPYEAISSAIESAEKMLEDLRRLRPESLREVAKEIDDQVAFALRTFLEEADLYDISPPGTLKLRIHDDFEKKFDLLDVAREIAGWRQEDMVSDFDSDAAKEAWAQKFDEAAAIVRSSKELKTISGAI